MAVLKFRVDADGGWCDAQSGEPVPEHQIKARYEPTLRPTLREHSGIRLLQPELFDDYDPHRKMFLRAVALQHDVGPLEVSEAEARRQMRGVEGGRRQAVVCAAAPRRRALRAQGAAL